MKHIYNAVKELNSFLRKGRTKPLSSSGSSCIQGFRV